MTTARKLRFRDEPFTSPATGLSIRTEITANDLVILNALALHFHYLSPYDAAPLFERDYSTLAHRMKKLRINGRYLRLSPEQENKKRQHYWGQLFYAIDKAGLAYLYEKGIQPPKRHNPASLEHQVMIDQVMTSIAIGVQRSPNLELIWWEDILASGKVKSETPLEIPLSGKRHLRADGLPFALKRTFERTDYMFFIGMEADCGHMPIETSNAARSSLQRKFSEYIEIIEQRIYNAHFGVNTCFVPFFIAGRARKETAMRIWERMTADKPAVRKSVLFANHPTISFGERLAPGQLVSMPLERVGHPPIILNQP
jgi:hypothetical protein